MNNLSNINNLNNISSFLRNIFIRYDLVNEIKSKVIILNSHKRNNCSPVSYEMAFRGNINRLYNMCSNAEVDIARDKANLNRTCQW